MQCNSGQTCLLLVCITAIAVMLPAAAPAQIPPAAASNHYTLASQRDVLEAAEAMFRAGELDDADITFRRAFESVRADQGLFNEAQLPVLDRLLATNLARQDWEHFNYYLDYHGALTRRVYQNQGVRYAEALEGGADWHQQAALLRDDEHRTWHLIRARNLIWQAVSALEQTPGSQTRLAPLLYRIATLHFYLTTEASLRGLTSLEVRTDRPVRVSGWSMSGNEAVRRSYTVGQELLERIYRMHEATGSDHQTLAGIDTLLGDWQLLFGRNDLARSYYHKAYQALRTDPSATAMIEQLFGAVVPLPAPYAATLSYSTPSGNELSALSAMNIADGLIRPQLTDDFFTEDHRYAFDQVTR